MTIKKSQKNKLNTSDSKLQTPNSQLNFFLVTICLLLLSHFSYAAEPKEGIKPVIINGDQVEYSTENKTFSASGNVEVDFKGVKLTCRKLTGNMETKEVVAEGNARMDDKLGVIEGEKIIYNMQNKSGVIVNAGFRSNPYFGRAQKADKVSEGEFMFYRGYMTTCSYDIPHWKMKSKKVNFFPGDKIQMRDATFFAKDIPLMHVPQFNRSLQDPLMHVQMMPGNDKTWGPYMLTAWRYSLAENLSGRIYADYRSNFGISEGFGSNYKSDLFGNGDFKFYYTQERDKSKDLSQDDVNIPKVFERYLIRWREKWDISERTNLVAEYYKINDSKNALYPGQGFSFLKEYFYREYEKDEQPPTYATLHHSFDNSSLDFIIQQRSNSWYNPGYLEKLPELKYSLPTFQIASTPLYFDNNSLMGNYNQKNNSTSPLPGAANIPDVHANRIDTINKISNPMRVAFIQFTPSVSSRQTFYSGDINGSSVIRTVFSSGADMSTKFYRVFNINTNLLGLDINGLRHIITPTVSYVYNHTPTIPSTNLRQIDSVDTLTPGQSFALELSNKLQTKRQGQSVDLADFRVNSNYLLKPKTGEKSGSNLSDILFDLELRPFSWLTLVSDATYNRSVNRQDTNYNRFTIVNYDMNFNFATGRSLGVGQRYLRKGTNEITLSLDYRINPKWKFRAYQRFNKGHVPGITRGLREQEYGITRDLHCWEMDINYNMKRGDINSGETIWIVFRLKAFPELEFKFDQSYHQPKPGSQINP